jgi:hypothetical protein
MKTKMLSFLVCCLAGWDKIEKKQMRQRLEWAFKATVFRFNRAYCINQNRSSLARNTLKPAGR